MKTLIVFGNEKKTESLLPEINGPALTRLTRNPRLQMTRNLWNEILIKSWPVQLRRKKTDVKNGRNFVFEKKMENSFLLYSLETWKQPGPDLIKTFLSRGFGYAEFQQISLPENVMWLFQTDQIPLFLALHNYAMLKSFKRLGPQDFV